jgi:ubiquinone/menaquinone biosynthesis C-methylase UbiE
MGLYADHIFPRVLDRALGALGAFRKVALMRASGDVLEVGFGTGLNLSHYPKTVRSLVALDPMTALRERVEARIAAVGFPVRRVSLPADGRLPFDDACFDCIVSTWTLCSIDDAAAALGEMRRVLKPAGQYLFLEHGRSDDPGVARWQRRLTPLQRWVAGCRLDLPVADVIRRSGFDVPELNRFVLPKHSRLGAEMYQGVARPVMRSSEAGAPGAAASPRLP